VTKRSGPRDGQSSAELRSDPAVINTAPRREVVVMSEERSGAGQLDRATETIRRRASAIDSPGTASSGNPGEMSSDVCHQHAIGESAIVSVNIRVKWFRLNGCLNVR